MSAVSNNVSDYTPIFSKEKFDDLNKKWYGLSDKDLGEIYTFINEFDSAMQEIPDASDYDGLKNLIKCGNKIPSHCGYIVCAYYVNNYGDNAFNKVLVDLYENYKTLFERDPESTKTTDLYETLACLVQFAPTKTLRKFILDNFAMSKEIYKIMRKRPSTNATMSARYAELFVTSKFDDKYSALIYENYNAMIEFLRQKNDEIDGVSDAVKINFNQLRDIMRDFYERDKKESLKKVNKLINKKADIGEAFFYFIALNPSCAMEVIMKNNNFTGEFIEQFLPQLKIQYIVELAILLENIQHDKKTYMNYIQQVYKLDNIDSCYERLSNILRKEGLSTYGVLLRQISFYPRLEPNENVKNEFVDVLSQLRKKLSSVANNLTADISEKSMSITIVPLGRSRTYQDIMDKIEGVDESGGGFAAKLRDKDIIKKIRESGLSWYTMDQNTGEVIISVIETIQDVYRDNPSITGDVAIKTIYKALVLKYGIIMTLPYFKFVFECLNDKVITSPDADANEDYEEM